MMIRERTFYSHTLDSVYFGVGSFGADKSNKSLKYFFFPGRLDLLTCVLGKGGLCYRIKTNTLDRDIIMQVVTTDSGDGNVHLMSADGGAVCISKGLLILCVIHKRPCVYVCRYWFAEFMHA